MPGAILVAYGTKHGSTREVAEAITETLEGAGLQVAVAPAGRVRDLAGYSGVVLGGAIYMGRWHPDAMHFLEEHRSVLAALPVAVFGMGPRTLDADDVAESRAQLERALARVPDVDPFAVTVFGGVVDPRALRFPFSHLPASDARDWERIRDWAAGVARDVRFGKAAAGRGDGRRELQQTPR